MIKFYHIYQLKVLFKKAEYDILISRVLFKISFSNFYFDGLEKKVPYENSKECLFQ